MKRVRVLSASMAMSLCAVLGCGPAPDGEDLTAGETVRGPSRQLFRDQLRAPANALVSTEEATSQLAEFWAWERFERDGGEEVYVEQSLSRKLLAKAQPDECFTGVGGPIGKPNAKGKCAAGQPKVNDAYVWGITKYDKKLFFGTIANTHCLVEDGFLGIGTPQITSKWVCEFDSSASGHGDFRPPNIFMYDLKKNKLTPLVPLPGGADMLRMATIGLRSAGSLPGSGVAFVAGPSAFKGVNVFALDSGTGALLDAFTIGADTGGGNYYNNVRMWAVANGALYVGVGATDGGAVLRWTGSKSDLRHFEEVGRLLGDAANMTLHTDGRLYVTTWPTGNVPTGLFRSPVIPPGGLTGANVGDADWTIPLWLATAHPAYPGVPAYDPDAVTGHTIGGGAIVSFNNRIYFGTMSVPFVAAEAASAAYGLPESELLRTALGTHRSIAIFEVRTGAKPKVSMLFGEKYLPMYEAAEGGYTIKYDKAHRTGFTPRWGASGAGNFFNTYTWAGAVYDGEVWFGTFDWSQLARVMLQSLAEGQGIDRRVVKDFLDSLGEGMPREGADVIRFDEWDVYAETVNGFGNDTNYGIRNMVTDGEKLWIGTANPMNLDKKGGWELLETRR